MNTILRRAALLALPLMLATAGAAFAADPAPGAAPAKHHGGHGKMTAAQKAAWQAKKAAMTPAQKAAWAAKRAKRHAAKK